MKPYHGLSSVEQLARHLQAEILAGTFGTMLPGVHRLARELGVSPKTVVAAVAQLTHEGLLEARGARRRHRINLPDGLSTRALKIGVIPYEKGDMENPLEMRLTRHLEDAGHLLVFPGSSLQELKMDVARVEKMLTKYPVDAWIVIAGSREVLEWFATQPFPTFALFGVMSGIDIAGGSARKIPAMQAAVRRLVELGHRRIVMLTRKEKRQPRPALFEQAFLDELEAHRIITGSYNLPDWGDVPGQVGPKLDALFRYTPPTAMLVVEAQIFLGVQHHLARRGIIAPERISLVSDDLIPSFEWIRPTVAHLYWDPELLLRGVLSWVRDVARGRTNRKKVFSSAEFIEGGTIGPVKGGTA